MAMPTRREFLTGLAALLAAPPWARAAASATGQAVQLAATWQTGDGYQLGVVTIDPAGRFDIVAALDVPTRAHGFLHEPGGKLLAVARRPGHWLLRWNRQGQALAWHWIEPRRAFAGHVLASPDGATLYTTEMDLDSGAGLIGVRDAATLQKRDEWPTHGIDPHQLILDKSHPGSLIVANGGVPTQPETGRLKRHLEGMDSSLVRLDAGSGELLGQWRLDDPRLSLRHLAWGGAAGRPVLGIALQAEHDAPADKASAPVLALFDGDTLRAVPVPRPLAGYGGDIAALAGRFAVSCPRSQGVAVYGVDGEWKDWVPLTEAYALAATPQQIWVGGRLQTLGLAGPATPAVGAAMPDIRLDNHWIALQWNT
ncbi:MAG: DUF1513 domain-containing protein [Hydrogenophilaceae bacterium]|nr:DUF1513 domain-containing protein [Hydrogenophilaceae bacterium]